ncbi:hypothetical protein [Amycolatopsis sp. Hca4]|uniref:hypothetical protein n=1 Tax=Amycolatopsis sp. Hca4 TaxID=2742131 RepID=UPI0015924D1E|nr:hypothetical protein [Amycolatopsis sp. Hca4]QKV76901.1 hypothetical protein HUT10_26305 [Amycolatopsis sp. Hca4]
MLIADGGGGSMSDIVNPFSSGSMDTAVKAATAETQKLLAAANGGGFRVSPEGVAPIKKALTDLINDLNGKSESIYLLNQSPQLGNHPYGHTVAAHDHKGAAEAEGSASTAIEELKKLAEQAGQALDIAVAKYNESDSAAFDALKYKR